MNNIPVFMSQGGTATLILREIPHRETAYIILRTILPGCLDLLISECMDFCRGCGAKTCFLSAEDTSVSLPLPVAYDIYHLRVQKDRLPEKPCPFRLEPMTPENDSIYQRIYNQCFSGVSHALTYDREQISRIYRLRQSAFLALTPERIPCGIGELHENELAAVGLLPPYRGSGTALTLSLLAHCPGPEITLTVVSDNLPALRLYDRLGFAVTQTESRWYCGERD